MDGWMCDKARSVFSVEYTIEGFRKLLHFPGLRLLSPRPIHPKADKTAQDDFRHTFGIWVEKIIPVSRGNRCGHLVSGCVAYRSERHADTGMGLRIVRDQRFTAICLQR